MNYAQDLAGTFKTQIADRSPAYLGESLGRTHTKKDLDLMDLDQVKAFSKTKTYMEPIKRESGLSMLSGQNIPAIDSPNYTPIKKSVR
mmetsp:Transcript_23688/g.36364  ORF Transcript_23688/g.36364 Transcript_23688/m.36364 type:complete len:88 (+) Transcript_23688:357-620(+)